MGSQTTQNTYQPTSTENQLMSNELQYSNAGLQGSIQNQGYAQNLQGLLMTGQGLPGYLSSLPGGISQGQSMNEAALGNQSIAAQTQQMGGLDSGSGQQMQAANTANTLNTNAQFNVQNLAQLMNLASGNAYQNVGMGSSNNYMLGSQSGALAGSNSQLFANPFSQAISAVNAVGNIAGSFMKPCWVASEIFGGWYNIDTILARFYVCNIAPKWFLNFYIKYGETIAKFISNKPILKKLLRPLFEYFASKGKEKLNGY